ncbi:MAG: ankyrin repeat domain-containing protein [Clostridia bacterium]|nr:ankyrin repeat domain-containing protein [Clostridia bacterium]
MNEKQKITRSRSKDPLLTVVKRNYLEMAELLIKHGTDVTCFDNEPIIEAVRNDNFEMVKLLIDSGADASARNNEPLKIAIRGAKYGNPEIMDYLILNGADSSLVDDSMYYILNSAIRYGNIKMVEYIISNGADVTYNDNEAICIAADSYYNANNEQILGLLIKVGADVNARHGYPLIAASYYRFTYDISLLINNGADIHACEHCALLIAEKHHNGNVFYRAGVSSDVRTDFTKCIEYAAKHRYTDIVELLLSNKNVDDYLVYSTERCYSETVKFLLDSGYEGDKIEALKIACRCNYDDIIEAIIDSGCDFKDQYSLDLITTAVVNCSAELVKRLIDAGVQLTEEAFFEAACRKEMETLKVLFSFDTSFAEEALKGAFESGDINIVEFITSNYISISSCFIDDLLRSAIYGGNTELIKLIIDNGVEPDQIFEICRGAVFNIIENGNYELLIFLLDLGMKASDLMLESAVFRDQVKCAKVLLEKGVLPTEEIIQEVFNLGRTEILEAFFDAGVPII